MTEALNCVIEYGFRIELEKIEANTHGKMKAQKNISKTNFRYIQHRKIKNNDANYIYELLK
jgi:hypothetical protein